MTLPAAASIQGLAPFFTDVRVFNTSYTASLEVTATYRCFLGDCAGLPPRRIFTLLPRESAAFNDMVAADFHAPNSAGAVELDFDGAAEQVVATSRLYSTAPSPTVGMFVPGLPQSRAVETAVLTSVRNRGPGKGFRTNVGVFNPGDLPVLVILTVLANGFPAGSPVVRTVLAHSGVQVNAIFAVAGAPDTATSNGVVVVS
ncbi:MAG TPA: hypothetical protein VLH41_11200, partial [Thermoanaerobaculia bacterium]|nr:hypothetical protein [Thermoanaerobaculia bacterium]